MNGYVPWPWAESLGSLRPDPEQVFRVQRIVFGLVRDRCQEVGLHEGQEIRCRNRDQDEVAVELPGGQVQGLELPYAWFVQVAPVQAEPRVGNA